MAVTQKKINRKYIPLYKNTVTNERICVPIQSHHQQIKIETQFVAGLFTVSLQLLWRFPLPILVFVSFFQCILTIWRLYSHNNHSVCQDCVLEQLVLSAFWFFWFIHCIFFSFTPVQVISLFAIIQMWYRSMLLYCSPKLLSYLLFTHSDIKSCKLSPKSVESYPRLAAQSRS